MRYRILGRTGLKIAEVGFGGWAIGGNRFGQSLGHADDAVSLEALNRAYELGCNLFVTSDLYGRGHSETLIGQALKGWRRDDVIIATQGGYDTTEETLLKAPNGKPNFSKQYLLRSVEASLTRLGVDAIDLYLLHTPPLELIQHGQIFDTLSALKTEGKIRFAGVSIQDPQEGIQAIQRGQVDVIMAVYNFFDTRAERQLFSVCRETETGLLVREPLARGFLSGAFTDVVQFEKGDVRSVWPKPFILKRVQSAQKFAALMPPGYQSLAQFALAYALHEAAVSAVVPDCKTPDEVVQNCAVTHLQPVASETMDAIRALQARL
jgi:aryl-alcohol dehydrogenase-like predicted oxidoreductase